MTSANPHQIDDTDSRVRYSGRWETAGSPDAYNATTHGTNSAGAQVEFFFNGTSVAVYGTIEAKSDSAFSAASTYSIDGSSPTSNTGLPGNTTLYNQLFYRSPNLADGQHSLIITSTLGGGSMFWLDYFQVVPSGANSTPNSTSLPEPLSTPTTSTGSSEAPTLTSVALESGRSRIGGGAIAGIAVGGLICLLLALFLVWLWRRRARPAHFNEKPPQSASSVSFWEKPKRISTEVTPFNLASPPTTPAAQSQFNHQGAQSSIPATASLPIRQGNGYSVGTTLVEKRGPGANHSTAVLNSPETDRLSMSQTLVNPSSPTGYNPIATPSSGPSKGDLAPRPRRGAPTQGGSDGPPAYT